LKQKKLELELPQYFGQNGGHCACLNTPNLKFQDKMVKTFVQKLFQAFRPVLLHKHWAFSHLKMEKKQAS